MTDPRDVLARVVRDSRGRLIAYLAARSGDMASAEDALADAVAEALRQWPDSGLPEKPEAWLVAVARRRLSDRLRRAAVHDRATPALLIHLAGRPAEQTVSDGFPDERLKLLFVAAHPAIDPAARAPLILQTLFGLTAERIAAAFLVSPASMSQRLVRAKEKIRTARIPFRIPEPPEWSERLDGVLQAIYAAYATGWDDDGGASGLADDALHLARMVTELLPHEPEPAGLLALILFSESRKSARFSGEGKFVPLLEQDPADWNRDLRREAEQILHGVPATATPGRFLLEATIQSVHARRPAGQPPDWPSLEALYARLTTVTGSLGAWIARAAARSEAGRPADALAMLDQLPADRVRDHQPYWATRAHVLHRAGETAAAVAAWQRAAGLTRQPEVRRWLLDRAAAAKNPRFRG
jgi:RNA polymerase sigma-70 factor (ECF subfamily)